MEITTLYFLIVFALALALGFVSQKSTLCLAGSIRDGLNDAKWHRMATFVIAIGAAIFFTSWFEFFQLTQLDETRPPYRTEQFAWGRYILGGFIFGVGMMLASGCGMRNLIKFGQGSFKALVMIIIMSLSAYMMTRTTVYESYFLPWLSPMTLELNQKPIISNFITSGSALAQLLVGLILGLVLIALSLKNKMVRSIQYAVFGIIAGLITALAYVVTGGQFGEAVIEHSNFMEQPLEGLGSQSFTFSGPMGDVVYWLEQGMSSHLITFGVLAIFGMILGSLISALINKNYSFLWFTSKRDFIFSSIGAIMVGVGAVMAMGCSIGHGITGVSTLALGSVVALISILAGGWVGTQLEKKVF